MISKYKSMYCVLGYNVIGGKYSGPHATGYVKIWLSSTKSLPTPGLRYRGGLHLVFIVYACLSNKSGQNFILFTKLTT